MPTPRPRPPDRDPAPARGAPRRGPLAVPLPARQSPRLRARLGLPRPVSRRACVRVSARGPVVWRLLACGPRAFAALRGASPAGPGAAFAALRGASPAGPGAAFAALRGRGRAAQRPLSGHPRLARFLLRSRFRASLGWHASCCAGASPPRLSWHCSCLRCGHGVV